MDLSRLNEFLEQNIMQSSPSSGQQTQGLQNRVEGRSNNRTNREPGGPTQGLPAPLPSSELIDMQRCFRRANAKVEGYLDFEELKTFMELRRCPITDWEAAKLLKYADPTYHYYISLDQILELTTLYGFGTSNPVQMTRSEFDTAVKHAFRLTSTGTNDNHASGPDEKSIDFNAVLNYFESKVTEERQKEKTETSVQERRKMRRRFLREEYLRLQNSTESKAPKMKTRGKQQGVQDQLKKNELESKPSEGGNKKSRIPVRIPSSRSVHIKPSQSSSTQKLDKTKTNIVANKATVPRKESPSLKSLYKRTGPSKLIPSGHQISNGITSRSLKNNPIASLSKDKCFKIPPPLPPPIVPDTPAEWSSNYRANSHRTSSLQNDQSPVPASKVRSTETIYRNGKMMVQGRK